MGVGKKRRESGKREGVGREKGKACGMKKRRGVSREKRRRESGKRKARVGKKEGVSREKKKARIGKKRWRESGTKNTGKGKAVRQLSSWMLGYSLKLIFVPGFVCVMSSYFFGFPDSRPFF